MRELARGGRPAATGTWSLLTVRRVRLITGLWLLFYATSHLLNHALGLVSLATAEEGRALFVGFWRTPPVEASLALALVIHAFLGLWRLWQRRTMRMPALEALQLLLGLLIPLYLTAHVLGTGWLHRCCGVDDSYAYVLGVIWPRGAWSQSLMASIVWGHGMIGLHQWLRAKPGAAGLRPTLLVLGTLVPTLALAGFAAAGKEVAALRDGSPVAWAALGNAQGWPTPGQRAAWMFGPERWIVGVYLVLAATILLLQLLRWAWQRRRNVVLHYPGGRQIVVPRGLTVLEASRIAGIPHAAVCGGRGRCSTCRIRIGRGAERLAPPGPDELRVLDRIAAPPDVRLACQVRLAGDLALTPLLPAGAGTADVLSPTSPALGVERELVVLFGDLRGFTSLSESRLPYDTVFVLNRYFAAMGEAIEAAGGRIDKFIGDGVMALFGIEGSRNAAAHAALVAAGGMIRALEHLNRELAFELDQPLRMGLGMHLGPVVLGEMGHGASRTLTAVGDTVNVASRLETLTKELGCVLVVSERLIRAAEVELPEAERRELDLVGRAGRLAVRLVRDPTDLPAAPASISASGGRGQRRGPLGAGWA